MQTFVTITKVTILFSYLQLVSCEIVGRIEGNYPISLNWLK